MKVTTKIIWTVVIVICLCALGYIWFIGFPVPEYVATDDGATPKSYVVQIAPYTYFNVNMSDREVLTRTDGFSFYEFDKASILTNKSTTDADLINAEKQVYGRPGSFIYRIFDECTITVRSDLSTIQPFTSFTTLEPYEVPGYFETLKKSKDNPPTYDELPTFVEVMEGVYAERNLDYDVEDDGLAFTYYGAGGSYYTAHTAYGTSYEVIQQSLSKTKACAGVTFDEYYAGPDYWLFTSKGHMLAIKKINRNTNIVLETNITKQMPALLYTLQGGD